MTFTVYGLSGPEHWPLEKVFKEREPQPIAAIEKTRFIEKHSSQIEPRQKENPAHPTSAYEHIKKLNIRSTVMAEELMSSPVITLTTSATIAEALQLFQVHKFRHLPVVDTGKHLVGIVSDRDVLRYLADLTNRKEQQPSQTVNTGLEFVMKSNVLAASSDTDVRYIARLFVERRIGAIPITNNDEITGIITRNDVLSAVMRNFSLELWV